jgi:malonyl-CoA/methylmalonyl-CoA synthetase
VAVQAEKSVELVFLYLACLQRGAVYLPLNTAYQPSELAYFLGDAEPRLFVVDPQRRAQLAELASANRSVRMVSLGAEGEGELAAAAASAAPLHSIVERSDDDLAAICYTSGTTGRSKGAMISHGNLASNAAALVQTWGFSAEDVLLHALPVYHVHGLFVALHCAFLSGARMLFQERFAPERVIPRLADATVMMGVPTYYTRLLADPRFDAAACRGMRLFISGSAPLLADTFDAFAERTGHCILERYGMTETGMIASNPLHGERIAGTVGKPLPGVGLRIADNDGAELPAGEVGMIEVRGPNVFRGYWRLPEKTAAELRPDGWFITGDLGVIGSDGYLRIVGRAKDLIISGGLNVYPKEVELLIDALPGVAESAVFGLPHPDFGEAVAAAVVAREGALLGEAELLQALRGQLAAFKLPKRIWQVDALPRNAMSKVQKAVLRERYGRTFSN